MTDGGGEHRVQVRMQRLERWLEDARVRPWANPQARLDALARALAPDVPEPPPDDLLPARTMVMWRLTRAMAAWSGLAGREDALADVTQGLEPDPWRDRVVQNERGEGYKAFRRTGARIGKCWGKDGLPLLPPWRDDDPRCERWCQVAAAFAAELGIAGHPRGQAGLIGLLDPRTARYSGVEPEHVLTLEELAIDEVLDVTVRQGERHAVEHLREQYGFARVEAVGLVRLARARAVELSSNDVQENRALLEAQLKDYMARAKDTMNMADELRALRELGRVQGLTRVDPDDLPADFLAVVARVSGRQDAQLYLPAPSQRADTESREIREAEFAVRELPAESAADEDEEALAEFDRERQRR